MTDDIALLLGVSICWYFYYKKTYSLLMWFIITSLLTHTYLHKSRLTSVIFGLIVAVCLLMYSNRFETFDDKEEKEEKEEKKEPTSTGSSAHVDLGTSILHAYRNLSPEQIGGMRRDTKELMELQKELMGTLAEMKPAIQQGSELLGTFSQFFGKPQ